LLGLIPGAFKNSANQERMEDKVAQYGSIARLLEGQRIANETLVPNQDAVDKLQLFQEKVRLEFDNTQKAVMGINEREPLLAGVFPLPRSNDLPFVYQKTYLGAFDNLLVSMHAKPPATREELRDIMERLYRRQQAKRPKSFMGDEEESRELSVEELESEFGDESERQFARTVGVFADLGSFQIGQWSQSPDAPAVEDMWFGQLEYWIQKDVAEIIVDINRPRKGVSNNTVLRAPVKHLVEIKVDRQYLLVEIAAEEDKKKKRTDKKRSLVVHDTGVSVTGRISNRLFEVVLFSFKVVIDSRRINSLLARLANKNLYCVQKVSFESVNHREASAAGLIYGADPVVILTVDAEALFLREAYRKWIPKGILNQLPGEKKEVAVQKSSRHRGRRR